MALGVAGTFLPSGRGERSPKPAERRSGKYGRIPADGRILADGRIFADGRILADGRIFAGYRLTAVFFCVILIAIKRGEQIGSFLGERRITV